VSYARQALVGLLVFGVAEPVLAFGPYPPETWRFTLEFRRFPMAASCHEEMGRGKLVRKKGGRNAIYELTGFPAASVIACTLPNGGSFKVNAAWYFDLPDDGVWTGTVERLGPGDIRAVKAVYTYKGIGPFVDGTYYFDSTKGRIKQSGGSKDMYEALVRGAKR
jgi:hypothetical protein